MKVAALLGTVAVLSGCRPSTVGEIKRQLSGNDYVQSIESDNHKLEFRFVPETLYLLTIGDIDTSSRFPASILKQLKAKDASENCLMFTMTLSPKDDSLPPGDFRNDVVYGQINGESDYRKTLDKLMFGLKPKIWLESNGKRYPMSTYHMNNTWGLSKSRSFTLMFSGESELLPEKKGKLVLVAEDVVPGQGRNRLTWNLPINPLDFVQK